MRSGRVKITAGAPAKPIIYVPSGSAAIRYYRVFNSGRNKDQPFTITGADGVASIAVLPGESIDFGVKNQNIEVTPHASEDADVVYDFLG